MRMMVIMIPATDGRAGVRFFNRGGFTTTQVDNQNPDECSQIEKKSDDVALKW